STRHCARPGLEPESPPRRQDYPGWHHDPRRRTLRGDNRQRMPVATGKLLMAIGRVRLSVAEARGLAEGSLKGLGYSEDDARIIADHVIDAALCGYEYSGLAKILNIPDSQHFEQPRRAIKVLRETSVSLAIDGGNNVGMLALFHAAEATIKKTEA